MISTIESTSRSCWVTLCGVQFVFQACLTVLACSALYISFSVFDLALCVKLPPHSGSCAGTMQPAEVKMKLQLDQDGPPHSNYGSADSLSPSNRPLPRSSQAVGPVLTGWLEAANWPHIQVWRQCKTSMAAHICGMHSSVKAFAKLTLSRASSV